MHGRLDMSRIAGSLTALLVAVFLVQPFLLPIHLLVSHGADQHSHHHKGSAGEANWRAVNCSEENEGFSAAHHCPICASYCAKGRTQAIWTNTTAFFPAALAVGYAEFAERTASLPLFSAPGRAPPVA